MIWALRTWETIVLVYFLIYNATNFLLLSVAWMRVRFFLSLKALHDRRKQSSGHALPAISLLVPAFNEEQTITENIKSLAALNYPHFEIIVVNDGSTDRTLDVLKSAFNFTRRDVGYQKTIPVAGILGFYEAPAAAGRGVKRLILIDKENAGKSDALNCALNAATSDYVCSMDADSLMNNDTLLEIMRLWTQDPDRYFACGGQVGIANGSQVENGRVVKLELPKEPLLMFQMVEYMRSFTAGRTALAALDSLVILSGVFAVFRKDILMKAGGFLTRRLDVRIAREYARGRETVCEDMEIVVRLHRYCREKNLPSGLLFLPHPITWSQAPATLRDFGRQRNRWYRGLAQVLFIHRGMILNPAYGMVGIFGMPYQFLFEFLGPLIEAAGYCSIPLLYAAGALKLKTFTLFLLLSIFCGMLLNIYAVVIGLWKQRGFEQQEALSLFRYRGLKNALKLIIYAALSMLGYRQLQLFYQLQGFKDFLLGSQTWGKFKRQKFKTA
ncbi:MAG: glycosyltransferase family 2 protein [Elusimicrobia bacterium]|nr:glycosyltransferase family 2 protein [Elusimicrobiota bacterium]